MSLCLMEAVSLRSVREAAYRTKLPHRGKQCQEVERETHTALMALPKVLDLANT